MRIKEWLCVLLIGILIGVSFILLYSLSVEANEYELVQRALYYNDVHVKYSNRLSYPQHLMTEEQAYNRISSIYYYVHKYNTNYNIDEIILTIFSIMEVETGFVNYAPILDNGKSFGIGSMQIETAKFVAKLKKEKWDDNIYNNPRKQIEYVVYYFYYLLNREGDLNKAIVSYNQGYCLGNKRIENYLFLVKGRVEYLQEVLD